MKVYIVFCNVDYEGSDVYGVYKERTSAEAVLKRLEEGQEHNWCDSHGIAEYDVAE
jgi:hypothetical protein